MHVVVKHMALPRSTCGGYFIFILALLYMGLSMFECFVLGKYYGGGGCNNFLDWILACCVIDFVTAVLLYCDIAIVLRGNIPYLTAIVHFAQFGTGVWVLIVQYDKICYDFLDANLEIWLIVVIHFAKGWLLAFMYGVLALVLIGLCVRIWYKNMMRVVWSYRRQDDDVTNSNEKDMIEIHA